MFVVDDVGAVCFSMAVVFCVAVAVAVVSVIVAVAASVAIFGCLCRRHRRHHCRHQLLSSSN